MDAVDRPPGGCVFHPSDFSESSGVAFAHALKIALVFRATLYVWHAAEQAVAAWHEFPGVRETLARWDLLPTGSPRSAVSGLGIDVRKVMSRDRDPVRAGASFLARHPADVVVLAVHRRDGRMRWLQKSVGQPLARRAGQMTLFIPDGLDGFVSRASGAVSLRHILIPIAGKPSPQPGIDACARFVRRLGLGAGTVTLLHVGDTRDAPVVKVPEGTGWNWSLVNRDGEAADRILEVAGAAAADLIVMTTDGPDGFLDGLRGTTSERVLSGSPCPVANLPTGARIEAR